MAPDLPAALAAYAPNMQPMTVAAANHLARYLVRRGKIPACLYSSMDSWLGSVLERMLSVTTANGNLPDGCLPSP